jgi:hypothetical protein
VTRKEISTTRRNSVLGSGSLEKHLTRNSEQEEQATMKHLIDHVYAAVVLSGLLVGSALAADDSPMGYFAEQDVENAKKNAPILAATTTDELIKLGALPKQYAARFAEMSAEEKEQLIDGVKQGLDSTMAVAEKVDGDRAVVLRESSYRGAWNKVTEMSRINGAWAPGNETMMLNDSGASGSFAATGVATAQLTEGWVAQSDGYYVGDKEFPIYLSLNDILGPYLDGKEVPTVAFSHPGCLTLGKHSISHPRGMFTTGGEEHSEVQTFDANISGTLEVTKVDADRFWAKFEMTAVARTEFSEDQGSSQAVNITGTVENAYNLCPGGTGGT